MARKFAAVPAGGPGRKTRKGMMKRRPVSRTRTQEFLSKQRAAEERRAADRRREKRRLREQGKKV